MIQLKFRQFQTDSEDDSAMIQKGIFHEGIYSSNTIVEPQDTIDMVPIPWTPLFIEH